MNFNLIIHNEKIRVIHHLLRFSRQVRISLKLGRFEGNLSQHLIINIFNSTGQSLSTKLRSGRPFYMVMYFIRE